MIHDSESLPLALQVPDAAIQVRSVRLGDMAALCVDCWSHRTPLQAQSKLRYVNKVQVRGRGTGLVVEDAQTGALIGYGQVVQWTQCAEISDLVVSSRYRGQGIGTALIQHLVRAARQHPRCRCVDIGAALSNPRALALYRRLGFQDSYQIEMDVGQGKERIQYLRLSVSPYRSV